MTIKSELASWLEQTERIIGWAISNVPSDRLLENPPHGRHPQADKGFKTYFGEWPALRRIARLANGWMVNQRSVTEARPLLDLFDHFLAEAGRSRSDVGLEARMSYGVGDPKALETTIHEWQAAGATHLSFNTMGSGFKSPSEYIQAIRKFAEVAFQSK